MWIAPEDAHITPFDVALRPGFLRSSTHSVLLAGEFRNTAMVYHTNAKLIFTTMHRLKLDEFSFSNPLNDTLLTPVFA